MQAVAAIQRAIYDSRESITMAIAFSFIGFLIGYVLSGSGSTGGGTPETPTLSVAIIFMNNATVGALLIAGGVLLGIPTAILLLQNGGLIGSLAWSAVASGKPSIFLALLLPHGVFELPALWLAGAAGFRFPQGLISYLRRQRDRPITAGELRHIALLVFIAAGLLVIGAIVEGTITVALAHDLSG